MENKYNHLFSINEQYKNGFWGTNNFDNKEKFALRNAFLAVTNVDQVKYTSSLIPKNVNLGNVLKSYENFNSQFNGVNTVKNYVFDIETVGSLLSNATFEEQKLGTITEFSLLSFDATKKGNQIIDSNYQKVANFTFGITQKELEQANYLTSIYEGLLNNDPNFKGMKLTNSELSSLKFFAMYGGEDISKTKGKGKYFTKENGIFNIKSHYESMNEFDLDAIKQGIYNMRTIGVNQGVDTTNGKKMLDAMVGSLNEIKANNSSLFGYNIDHFDIPFLQNFLNKNANSISSNIPDVKSLNTFDVRRAMQAGEGESIARTTYNLLKTQGKTVNLTKLGTLSGQALIRGLEDFEAHVALEDAPITTKMFFKTQSDGSSLYSDVIENVVTKPTTSFDTTNKGDFVLKAKKASRIDSNGGINGGMYDQYLVKDAQGKYSPVEYMSLSTNKDMHYKINKYGKIPKEVLNVAYPEANFNFETNQDFVYGLMLDNASTTREESAFIVRETEEEMQKVFNRFELKQLQLDHTKDIETAYYTTQGIIDIETQNKIQDNARRRLMSTREAKQGGIKLAKDFNETYELVNESFSQLANTSDKLSVDEFTKIVKGESNIKSDFIYDILDKKFPHSKANQDAFLYGYGKIADEYLVSNKIINTIENSYRQLPDEYANNYYNTLLYNKVLGDIENETFDYAKSFQVLDGATNKDEIIDEALRISKNKRNAPISKIGYDHIDLLNPIPNNLNKSDFYNLGVNDRYFGVTASHYEDITYSIMNKANSIAKNPTSILTQNQILNKKKSYVKALTKDLHKRGVIDKSSLKWYREALNSVSSDDAMFHIYGQLGGDLMNIVEKSKGSFNYEQLSNRNIPIKSNLAKSYKGLIKKDLNLNVIDSNKVLGTSYSDFVINNLHKGDFDNFISNSLEDYKSFSNITFIKNTVDGDGFTKSSAARWLKSEFGYTDEHIDTLKSALYGRNGIVTKTENGTDLSAYLFTMKDKRGNLMPAIGMSKKGATIEFNKNKLPENMSYMILPKLESEGIVKIGDVRKVNAKRLNIYQYNNAAGETITKASNRDLISRSISALTLRKNDIRNMIESGDYNNLTYSLNSTSKRIQLNEKGLSQNIVRRTKDGKEFSAFIPNKLDFDNINTVNQNEIMKMLPILYEDSASSIKANMQKAFPDGLADKYIKDVERVIKSNRSFTMENFSPQVVEWMYANAYSNDGVIKQSMNYFDRINDTKSSSIFKELLNGHSFIKDSNMTDFLVSMSPGIKANQLAQFTAYTRPTQNQGRGSLPFVLDYFNYTDFEKNYGIKFGSYLTSASDLKNYNIKMNENGLNVTTGFIGDVKQMKTGDAYLAIHDATINLNNKNLQKGDEILQNINKKYNTNYNRKDLNTALDVLERRTSFFEGGGLVKPGLTDFMTTEQIYSMEVGEDFFNSINEGDIINKNQSLGISRKGKKLSHKKSDVVILGKEEIGFDTDELFDKDKTFKVSYKFKNKTNPDLVKLSTFGGNEKGVFNTINLGEGKEKLARGLFEEIFGESVVAVSSAELFKHDSYGGILSSYINTIADEAIKYDKINKTDELSKFVSVLRREMPSMGYTLDYDPNTKRRIITHLNADEVSKTSNPFTAMKNVIGEYRGRNDAFGNKVASTIDYMEENQIFKLDIGQMHLTDSYAQNAKYNNKMIQLGNISAGKEVTERTRLEHRNKIRATKEYKEGDQIVSNIYTALRQSQGEDIGIIEDINIKEFVFSGGEPSYEELKKNKIFDFGRRNEYGAKINSYKVTLPEGLSVVHPVTNQAVNEVFLPSVKTYHLDGQVMLSDLQMDEENFILSLHNYMKEPGNINNRDLVQRRFNQVYKSMGKELSHKDGIKSKLMESIKYDTGGMEIIGKMVAPEFEFEYEGNILSNAPLDENGHLRKGTKIKGFLDRSANDILKFDKDKNVIGAYENIKYSELALKEKGVDFKRIGKQILVDKLDVESKFMPNILKAQEDIAMANIILDTAKMSNHTEVIESVLEQIEGKYERLGKEYFREVGVLQQGGRHPVMSKTSLGVQRAFLDDSLEGRTMIGNYVTVLKKWFGDVDSDQGVGKLIGLSDNGEFNLLPITSQEYITANIAYENSAKDNTKLLISGIEDYNKDFQEDKFIYSGNKLKPLELAEQKAMKSLGEDIVNGDFNLYKSEFHNVLAMKARSMKLAVSKPSIQNYNLREVAEHLHGADISNRVYSDMLDMTRLVEQNIISLKHIKDLGLALDTTPVDVYTEGLKLMTSFDATKAEEGFEKVVGVFNQLQLFGTDGIVSHDMLDGSIPYDELPTDVHKQLYSLREMLSENDAKRFYGNLLITSEKSDGKYTTFLQEAFSEDAKFINTEAGRNAQKILNDATNLEYLELDNVKFGINQHIQAKGFEPYKILELDKNTRDGFSKVVLQDLYSGDTTSVVGSTFDDISRQLSDLGFKHTKDPVATTLSSTDLFNKRFASYDDFVRETVLENTVGAMNDKNISSNKRLLLDTIDNEISRFGVSDEMKEVIEKEINSLNKTQKKAYIKSYLDKTKDVYFETENLINELRLTNTLEQSEVLKIAKDYYQTTRVDLTKEMNDGIRRKAIQANKKEVYKGNIKNMHYANLDIYMEHYKNKGEVNKIGYKGTSAIRSERLSSLVNENLKNKTFEELGKMQIKLGEETLSLNSMNIDEVVDVALKNTEKSKNVSRETHEVVKHYLSKIDTSNARQSSIITESRLRGMAETVTSAQNDVIREMARKSVKSTKETFISKTVDYVKANKMKSTLIAAASIGIASAITGAVSKNSALVPKNNAHEEKIDTEYQTRDSVKDVAPSSNKTVIVQSPHNKKGVNYKVSTRNRGSASNDALLKGLRSLVGNDANLRYREERDDREINESWLKDKMSDLF